MSVNMNLRANERGLLVVSRLYPGGYPDLASLYQYLQDAAAGWMNIRLGSNYRKIFTLKGNSATLDRFVDMVENLTRDSQVKALDVFLFLHGSDGEIIFEGGAEKTSAIKARLQAIDTKGKLRACYSAACYGQSHCQDLIAAGFRVTSGAKAVNANGAVELPLFLQYWAGGETYEVAVRKAGFASAAQDWAVQVALPSGVVVDSTKIVRGRWQTRITTNPAAIYEVTLQTGDVSGAGTDADVFIKLDGDSEEYELDNPGNDRERGDTDVYYVGKKDVGSVKRVTIRHDNSGNRPGWYLDEIAVCHLGSGKCTAFPCSGWLAEDEYPYKLKQTLDASSVAPHPKARYEIILKTGDMRWAGTDADVYIKLHGRCNGQNVNSRWVKLDITSHNDRQRGDTDLYHVKAVALDDIKCVTVKHSNTRRRPGWFLEKGAIHNMTSNGGWEFEGGWLADDEPPYRTERKFSVQRA
jgi:hypothetical protein